MPDYTSQEAAREGIAAQGEVYITYQRTPATAGQDRWNLNQWIKIALMCHCEKGGLFAPGIL